MPSTEQTRYINTCHSKFCICYGIDSVTSAYDIQTLNDFMQTIAWGIDDDPKASQEPFEQRRNAMLSPKPT